MNIDAVTTVDTVHTFRVVPDPDSYTSVSSEWAEEEFRAFELDNGSLGGLWRGKPGSVYFERWPYTEMCVIINGHIAIEDSDGGRRDFRTGDAFVIPEGFRGTWVTVTPTEKYFVGVATGSSLT
ncbi:DUF861 domain-containing protein [Mycolicibacterium wolinskyi]|uniref:(S)-ureidoglycine aminohydrolase cupin domain-containing protein n=1 Tax=Mycolicibacterium wolinskyi TaxID=59750 RepID=A0A1X2F1M0_9MYCO|nr:MULTISPECIES: cupin domain-containing protein [Mycolicibacterium]MCV7287940.1 DUF861 domain-containing protein [Mycolicibacterium wolinskyi]MCV7294838.1 DUF861 domain-containing protein [Mycolicibacterium goodii]ORX12317.1 hypothetical protein AWC31_30415 [Mycolicibacterium wolinskyi]